MVKKNGTIAKLENSRESILKDCQAGNIIEYALLIGFCIFIFLLIVAIVVQIIDDATGGVWELEEIFIEWWKPDFTNFIKNNFLQYQSFGFLLIAY